MHFHPLSASAKNLPSTSANKHSFFVSQKAFILRQRQPNSSDPASARKTFFFCKPKSVHFTSESAKNISSASPKEHSFFVSVSVSLLIQCNLFQQKSNFEFPAAA
jgi:hypothetical protein